MATIDWDRVHRDEKKKSSFEALRAEVVEYNDKQRAAAQKKLAAKKGWTKVPEVKQHKYTGAVEYAYDFQNEVERLKKELDKYHKFFGMLKELTPRHFSPHDILG